MKFNNQQNMQGQIELKGFPLLEIKAIERRANCKIVQIKEKSYLIGGMTADAISNQVFQFRLNKESEPQKIEWKEVNFDNNLFSPRNSFSACEAKGRIYIWGGLQFQGTDQKTLSDLIQMDVNTGKMRLIPLKNPIKIHSASLSFDQTNSQFIAYGGSDENANLPAYLYRLPFSENSSQYEWIKTNLNCPQHQGYIWQHSSNLSKKSFFSGQQGKFMTVVGGCRFPHAPYNSIVEIDLETLKVTNSLNINTGLVSHDAVERDGKLFIFGGSNGGDFNSIIYVLSKGQITKLKGHRAIGCSCCLLEQKKIIVYGGVCGEKSINGAFIYQ